MDPAWVSEFRARMRSFELQRPTPDGAVSVSLKVRVTSGCFHREHSPHAYELIDRHLAIVPASQRADFAIVEHESGPELLAYLALATAGVTLAKSVIDLIVAIIKARADGVKHGDRPAEPVEVIIRRVCDGDRLIEETVLRIGHDDSVTGVAIEARIDAALKRSASAGGAKTANQKHTGPRRKRSAS
jgi:hypothetical protein